MSEPSWELLGGGGVLGPAGVDYIGPWSASVTYQPGQIVRYNGVDYLACNPSIGQTPPVASSLLLPTPVVNGQWIKGVGGAAVWSAITPADVGAVPSDAVVAAAVRLVANKLLAGDANPDFQITGDGKHQWGAGGASALDTNLYRYAAGVLKTDGGLALAQILLFNGIYVSPANPSNDWAPTGWDKTAKIIMNGSSGGSITGLSSQGGLLYFLVNISGSISLKHQNAGSSAPNQFSLPGATDLVLLSNQGCILVRNDASGPGWLVAAKT